MSIISEQMKKNLAGSSAIREMFEEGKRLAAQFGAENVYDFSIGNPSIPAPDSVTEAFISIAKNEDPLALHGYMSNAGHEDVRMTVAESLNKRYGTHYTDKNVIMTVGAACGMSSFFKAIINPGDEVIAIAPYFFEYNSYVGNHGGKIVVCEPDIPAFGINFTDLEKKITAKTRAVIIDSPNNPTGTIYSEEIIKKLGQLLEKKGAEFGTTIMIVSDEPYRELAYDGTEVPHVPLFYKNTAVVYSWSKTLSIPGERMGYVLIPDEAEESEDLLNATTIALRQLGFVNAPSIIQKVVAKCIDEKAAIEIYDENRKLLYNGLTEAGYECVYPQGAFYMFVKSPLADEKEFCALAKKKHIMMVPGTSFGCPGYVRIAYCTSKETILGALPHFAELIKEIK